MDDTARNINISGKAGVTTGLFNASYAQLLAEKHYVENLAANAHKKTAATERKKLLDHMTKTKAADFTFEAKDPNGNPITLNVEVLAPKREIVDIAKLVEEVGAVEAIKVCTASRAAVEAAFGKIVAATCGRETTLAENVTVKPYK